MRKFKGVIIKSILAVVLLCSFIIPTSADIGGFDRYDSGSSSSSSSDYSYSSSSDYSYSGSSYSGSSSSRNKSTGILGFELVWYIIIIAAILIATNFAKRGNSNKHTNINTSRPMPERPIDRTNLNVLLMGLKQRDPGFSEEKFLSFAKEVYIKLQNALTHKNWEEMRGFESKELFEQHNRQVQEFVNNKTTNIMERISVTSAEIVGYSEETDKEHLKVELRVVQRDYIIEDKTKKVIQGNKDEDRYMKYIMTYTRKKGTLSKQGNDQSNTINCPNCGAPTKITSSGQCEYCMSIITTDNHGWILTNHGGRRDNR